MLYVNKDKCVIVAGCIDGTLIFFLKNGVSSMKKEHIGDINVLCQNQEFFAAGGYDNTISFWKLGGSSLQSKIKLPGSDSNDPRSNDPKGKITICDMKFIGQNSSDFRAQTSYLIVL